MLRPIGLVVASFAVLLLACGTDAQGIEACRTIETARCEEAPRCQIDLSRPTHSGDDVSACIRWYREACLHGLAAPDPGPPAVDACVAAIRSGTCDVVLKPETTSACSWLTPEPTPDAGTADTAASGG